MSAERLYYADSGQTTFSATVTDIREHSRADGSSLWQIALDNTAFYPTSGGQPHDIGTLAATAPSGATLEAPIIEVDEDEHGEVWHLTAKPLLAGTRVEGSIDVARRLDHMQQHSGQHLLSALFYQELRAPTVSFHLGDQVSTIDLAIETLDAVQLAHIERIANAIVAEAHPVECRTVSQVEAERLLAAGKLRKLPPRSGDIRLVAISGKAAADSISGDTPGGAVPDLDLNACGGTHVTSTSRIGTVLIRGTERIRQSVRVSFVCGGRAIAAVQADDALLTQLSRALSTGRAELAGALGRLKNDARTGSKERQTLREELANYHAARLLVEYPSQQDLRIVRRIFPDRDAEYVTLLATRVTGAAPHTIALLASTQQSPATLVIASSPDGGSGASKRDANQLLRTALQPSGGRGGGSATLAQGQIAADQLDTVLRTLEASLRM